MKSSKLIIIGFVLLSAGVLMIATTVYQEKVEDAPPPDEISPEDYHMGDYPRPKYEWRSRAPVITTIGGILCIAGVAVLVLTFLFDIAEDVT